MKYVFKLTIILFIAAGLWNCGSKEEKNETAGENNTTEKQTEQSQQKYEQQKQQTQQNEKPDTLKKPAGDQTKEIQKEETNAIVRIKTEPDEKKFENDPKGQWPYDVDASSTRANKNDDFDLGYSNIQMIGKPNVKTYGDDKNAWSPAEQDKGNEWIRASYTRTVNATEVRVRQNYGPGTITKVELFDEKDQPHLIWEGTDNNKYEQNKIQYFVISFPKTKYKVKSVRITLSTNKVTGWNEIDAIQLVGE